MRMTDKRLDVLLAGGSASYGGIEWELLQALKAERAKVEELEARLEWLDNHTTFYDNNESDAPVLVAASERIWYHASDDVESYPFSKVIEAALEVSDE